MKYWTDLAVLSVTHPQEAAAQIIGLRLPRSELYIALVAVSALTALLASASAMIGPPVSPEQMAQMPVLALFERPLALFVLLAGGLIVMVHAIYWTGSAMGGGGDLGDLIALFSWLQALRVVAQMGVLVLSFAVPGIAALVALLVSILAFWLTLNFISAALRINSLLKAFGILMAVVAGLLVGLMFLITLLGLAGGA